MASESAVTLEGAAEPAPVESSVWDLWTCAESLPPKQRGSESAMLDARSPQHIVLYLLVQHWQLRTP